jgi:trans-aconitate methyltransferase
MMAIIGLVVLWSWINGISPMPTMPKIRKRFLEALPHKMEGKIVDLGSGWGTLVFPLARKYPKCDVIGYESSPIPYACSRLFQQFTGLPNLHIAYENFYSVPLEDARLVVCYLYPGAMRRLSEKFKRELKPGTWVASHTFALPGWVPEQTLQLNDLHRTKIYLYRIYTHGT